MRASVTLCLCLAAIGCGDSGSSRTSAEKELAEWRKANELLEKLTKAQRGELKQLGASLQGSKDALAAETARANRLAAKLNTTEMELSDAELLITELQEEIKRTRAALQQAQSDAERKAFERLKAELEKRRAAATEDLETRRAKRKQAEAAWAVALQKVLPPAKQLLNSDEEFKRYVAGFGFATDRPLFNIRVRPVFTTDDRAVTSAVARRLRDALMPWVVAGVKLAREQGHEVTFPSTPSLRFYDATAPDPDDAIGKIVAEWSGESDALEWRE